MTTNANEIQPNAQDNSFEAVQPLLNDLTPVQPIHPGDGGPITIQPMPLETTGDNDMTPVQPIYPGGDYGNDHSTQPVGQISPEPKPFWPGEGSDLTPVQPVHPGESDLEAVQPIYPGDDDMAAIQPVYPGDDYGNDHSTQPVGQISPEPKPFWPGEGSDLTPVQPVHPGESDLEAVQPIYPGDDDMAAIQPIYPGDDYGNDHSTQPVGQISPEPKPYWPGEGSDLAPVQPIYSGDGYGDHTVQPVANDLTPVQPIMPDWHCGTAENGTAFGNDTIAVHTRTAAGTGDQWWLESVYGQADVQQEANDGFDSASGLGLDGHDGMTGFGAAENAAYESFTQDLIV